MHICLTSVMGAFFSVVFMKWFHLELKISFCLYVTGRRTGVDEWTCPWSQPAALRNEKFISPYSFFAVYPQITKRRKKKVSLCGTCFLKSIIFWVAVFNSAWGKGVWMCRDGLARPSPSCALKSAGGERSMEKLLGWDKDRDILCQLPSFNCQNRFDLKHELNFLLKWS